MKWMRRIIGTFLVLAFICFSTILFIFHFDHIGTGYLRIKQHPGLQQNSYVITNVHVVPMNMDTILPYKVVVVEKGLIASISEIISRGNTYPVVDGAGGYLCPGLIDMHVQIWDAHALGLYLANGVTSVRNMWGILYHLRLKKEMETGFLIGPKLILATPKLTGPDDDGIDKIQLESPEEAIALLDKYKKKGYDVVKTCAGLPQPIYDAIVKKALVLGMPIAAHPGFEVPYAYHFKPGFESIEHTEEVVRQGLQNKLDSVKLDSVIALYLKSNIAHTPTLSIYQNIIDILSQGAAIKSSVDAGYMNPTFLRLGSAYDYNRWMTAQQKDPQTLERIKKQHEFHLYIVKKMHDAGVRLICGSNAGIMYAPAGFSTHEELGYYVQAGLTPYEALQTATANPSKASKYFANTGTILPGKKADLILSKNNPLNDLRTLQDPMAVWVGGVMIDSGRIDQFRQEAFQRKTGAVTLLRLLESLW